MPLKHWYMRVKDWFKETGVPPKGVRLVETIEPTVEDRGGFTIVIRGAFNRLVGRESQPSIDEVAANEFGVVRVYLNEAVQSEDEITVYVHESHVTRELHESAVTSDGVTYSIAEVYTETLTEVQSSSDEITYNVITAVITKHFEETTDSSDNISYTVFERVVLSFSETAGQASDSISSSVATRSVYRYLEKQYQNEIGTAYVPQGDETLEIKALTELQQSSDGITVNVQPAQQWNPFEGVYYYALYEVWLGTEEATIYGGLSDTTGTYAEAGVLYGGINSTEGINAEAGVVYGGLATTTLGAPST